MEVGGAVEDTEIAAATVVATGEDLEAATEEATEDMEVASEEDMEVATEAIGNVTIMVVVAADVVEGGGDEEAVVEVEAFAINFKGKEAARLVTSVDFHMVSNILKPGFL